jgi:hypothetical protein
MINWIKASERVPSTPRGIMFINIYTPQLDNNLSVGWYNGPEYKFCSGDFYNIPNVTHWAELSDINLPE